DGHSSHASALIIRYVWYYLSNIVHIICLPPHTTHKLQPLDVGVFGPVGKAWSKVTDDMLEDGFDISKKNLNMRYLNMPGGRNEAHNNCQCVGSYRPDGV
ncbi:hypothetical protein BT69DRAFT_1215923, partial [Atractiella rhizophila]